MLAWNAGAARLATAALMAGVVTDAGVAVPDHEVARGAGFGDLEIVNERRTFARTS